jgi:(2Fe-2S) ferredoxin
MAVDPKGRTAPGYERHMFICGHERSPEAARPSCKNRGSLDLLPRIKQAIREEGLSSIRVQKSGCLDFCENGIACVVYPEGTWYQLSSEMDIASIIKHLKDGTISTEDLMKLESE